MKRSRRWERWREAGPWYWVKVYFRNDRLQPCINVNRRRNGLDLAPGFGCTREIMLAALTFPGHSFDED